MFALMMCDDRISMQERRKEIMRGLKGLPGRKLLHLLHLTKRNSIAQMNFALKDRGDQDTCNMAIGSNFCNHILSNVFRPLNWTIKTLRPVFMQVTAICVYEV